MRVNQKLYKCRCEISKKTRSSEELLYTSVFAAYFKVFKKESK